MCGAVSYRTHRRKDQSLSDQPSASRTRPDQPMWVGVDPSEDEMRPPPLTRARIVRAALRLIDDRGLVALTMRALATELKVSPMALYNHVRDKEELLDLTLDLMLGEVNCTITDGDWLAQLRALVCSFDRVLRAHHHLARVYSTTEVRIGPNGTRIIERTIGLLRDAGFSDPDAADAFMTLYSYTVGRHQIRQIATSAGAAPQDAAAYYPALPAEQIPSIRAVSPYLGGPRKPGVFEYGVDLLLTGLQTKLLQSGDPSAPVCKQ